MAWGLGPRWGAIDMAPLARSSIMDQNLKWLRHELAVEQTVLENPPVDVLSPKGVVKKLRINYQDFERSQTEIKNDIYLEVVEAKFKNSVDPRPFLDSGVVSVELVYEHYTEVIDMVVKEINLDNDGMARLLLWEAYPHAS